MERLVAAAAVSLLLLAGCAQDSDRASADATPWETRSASPIARTAGESTIEVSEGVTTDDLVDCLTGAGLDAAFGSQGLLGLDVALNTVDVTRLESYAGAPEQGATLYVFENPTAATENAGAVTFGGSDDPTNERYGVHANVVRSMYVIMPEPRTPDEQALLGCLPAAASSPTSPTSPAESPTPAGSPVADLHACVTGAGLTATFEEGGDAAYYDALGVVRVADLANTWVFADAETASARWPDIFFGPEDSPRLRIQGPTVTVFAAPADPADPSVAALLACLPS